VLYNLFLFLRSLPKNDITGKAVFITGCDTGFGNQLAKRLDKMGVIVFAGCFTEDGAQLLRTEASDKLRVIMVDVTDEESVKNAALIVREDVDELYAVINNAGVLYGYYFEFTPIHLLRRMFDVNALGMMTVTKYFLPLVRGKGRIINTSSIIGRQAFLASGGYAASKFAIEGFSDTLRMELWIHNTRVIIVEPQGFKTPMTDLYVEHMYGLMEEADPEIRKVYSVEIGYMESIDRARGSPPVSISKQSPDIVVDAYITALTAKFPNTRYPVGWDAQYILRWTALLPGHVSDVIVLFYSWLLPTLRKIGIR